MGTLLVTFLVASLTVPLADAQYGIAVTPGKPVYRPGETVVIAVAVPEESNVVLQIEDPLEETILVESTLGLAAVLFEFTLEDDAEEGEYTIYVASVSEDGEDRATTTGNFQVSTEPSEGEEPGYIPDFITPTVVASIGLTGALVSFFRRH